MDVVESWMPIIIDMCQSEREKGRRQPGGGNTVRIGVFGGDSTHLAATDRWIMDHGSWVPVGDGRWMTRQRQRYDPVHNTYHTLSREHPPGR